MRIISGILAIPVFALLSAVPHTPQSSSHSAHASTPHASQNTSCISMCAAAPASKEGSDQLIRRQGKKHQSSEQQYLVLLPTIQDKAVHDEQSFVATRIDPPPGTPAHIAFAVLRI